MANTKAELVEAAAVAGYGTAEDLDALTKAEILDMFPEA
jgi:hypothetical protein